MRNQHKTIAALFQVLFSLVFFAASLFLAYLFVALFGAVGLGDLPIVFFIPLLFVTGGGARLFFRLAVKTWKSAVRDFQA